jgi:hypothetical protein
MLPEIGDAEDRDHAVGAAGRFDAELRPKWPNAADKIRDDLEVLLTFYDFPAEHGLHLRTPNRECGPDGVSGRWVGLRQSLWFADALSEIAPVVLQPQRSLAAGGSAFPAGCVPASGACKTVFLDRGFGG